MKNEKLKLKNKTFKKIKKELPEIQRDVPLSKYTTFRIGGRTEYFFEARAKEDLIKAVIAAKSINLPFFILGNGSNVLAADDGFDGLIIKTKNQKPKTKTTNQKLKTIEAETGTLLSQILSLAIKNNLTGLEWAAGIPGTVGGAIWGNAGAFGRETADIIKSVEVLEVPANKIKKIENEDCNFRYRESIFKEKRNLIILSAEIQLKRGGKKEIEEKIKEYLNCRKTNQPLNFPSAGSVFKNPKGFFAAELIEKCGLKGKRIGNAKISEKHANFIVNLGGAKSADVKKLIDLAKKEVKKKFRIELEEEIQCIS